MSNERECPVNNVSSPDSTPGYDVDDILSLQTQRAELANERDSLVRKRAELKQAIDGLSTSLAHYKKQQLQIETKEKLEYYLHQNDHESARLTQPDEASSFILKNMSVLPSNNLKLRMELINKFYPYMSVMDDSVHTKQVNDQLYSVITYRVSAENLPPLRLSLTIKDETIHELDLLDFNQLAHVFNKVSQSFCHVLTSNYCPMNKIDMIMHSYHSLAQAQRIRIATLTEVLMKYSDVVTRPASWNADPKLTLLSLDYIELTIVEKSKKGNFKVRLKWNIVLKNTAVGEVESKLCLSVHHESFGPLRDANSIFLTLVPEHGVVDALSLMLFNLFGA